MGFGDFGIRPHGKGGEIGELWEFRDWIGDKMVRAS